MGIPHGYQGLIAETAGISESLLCDILKGRRRCKIETADALVKAAKKILHEVTTVRDWQFPGKSKRKLFRGVSL